jgi:hypothetical protein
MEPVSNTIQANDSTLLLPIEDTSDQLNSGQAAFTFVNDKIAEIGYGAYQHHLFWLCGSGWLAGKIYFNIR